MTHRHRLETKGSGVDCGRDPATMNAPSAINSRPPLTEPANKFRRCWLRCFARLIGCLLLAALGRPARSDEQQATLNETLRSVLRCRRPQEFAFVNLVTQKVDQGQLPKALVLSMMNWASKRSREEVAAGQRKNDIPFPYFQEGLRRRAAEIGVDLPPFSP